MNDKIISELRELAEEHELSANNNVQSIVAGINDIIDRHQSSPIDPDYAEFKAWKENRGKVDTGSMIERLESLVKCDSHGGSWRGVLKDLIKEYKHGPSADGKLRAKMAAIVFHAAGRPLTEEENMKICNMALEVTK